MPRKLTTQQFVEKAKSVHGDTYDYSLVEYINNKTKVKIICKEHGVFEQSPNNHLNYGCKFCGGTQLMSTEEFIAKAKETHGDKYNYNKVNYINAKTKVTITCPIHEDFEQVATDHIQGANCYDCGNEDKDGKYNKTNIEKYKNKFKKQDAFVYLIEGTYNDISFVKIGITKNLKDRFYKLPFKCSIIDTIKINLYDAFYIEQKIVKKFVDSKIKVGKFAGHTECFEYNIKNEIQKYLNELK